MAIHVLLTVDLDHRVTTDQRSRFNECLKKKQWVKSNLTTTWWARFKQEASARAALDTAFTDAKACAAEAGITVFEMCAHAGDQEPEFERKP